MEIFQVQESDYSLVMKEAEEQKKLLEERFKRYTDLKQDALKRQDLSENAQYSESVAELQKIQKQRQSLEELFNSVQKIPDTDRDSDIVRILSKVKLVIKEENLNLEYTLGITEAPSLGKLSVKSLLGRTILGKRQGDSVLVAAPKGNINYTILEVINN